MGVARRGPTARAMTIESNEGTAIHDDLPHPAHVVDRRVVSSHVPGLQAFDRINRRRNQASVMRNAMRVAGNKAILGRAARRKTILNRRG